MLERGEIGVENRGENEEGDEPRELRAGPTVPTNGNVLGAVEQIRKIEDQTTRLVLYLEALKSLRKKHDDDLTRIIVNEARQAATSVGERMRLALEEGRRAMLDTEAELRGRVLDGGS